MDSKPEYTDKSPIKGLEWIKGRWKIIYNKDGGVAGYTLM
tara:strand:+ start:724 stop:843 length:120 start_codon:yes stop_codon:yes gene_type:complete